MEVSYLLKEGKGSMAWRFGRVLSSCHDGMDGLLCAGGTICLLYVALTSLLTYYLQ
jgi:hypothetical protein